MGEVGDILARAVLLLSSPGLTGRSSTPRPFDSAISASGILGRPVTPGDDESEMWRVHVHQT